MSKSWHTTTASSHVVTGIGSVLCCSIGGGGGPGGAGGAWAPPPALLPSESKVPFFWLVLIVGLFNVSF